MQPSIQTLLNTVLFVSRNIITVSQAVPRVALQFTEKQVCLCVCPISCALDTACTTLHAGRQRPPGGATRGATHHKKGYGSFRALFRIHACAYERVGS